MELEVVEEVEIVEDLKIKDLVTAALVS